MIKWLERHMDSSYLSFVAHMTMGASRLKNPNFYVFLFITTLGSGIGTDIGLRAGLSEVQATWIGVPFGSVVLSIIVWLIALGYTRILYPFPSCAQGKCHKMSDYKWSIGTIYGWEEWGVHHYWCNCGDEYVRHKRRFMRMVWKCDANGETWGKLVPYKKLVGFRKWADDTE